ncbi:MAG: hypothetical protein ACK5Q5_11635 [Planctomycetaceae bacterium]
MSFVSGLISLLFLAGLSVLPSALQRLRPTTLVAAGRWSVAALAAWGWAWLSDAWPVLRLGWHADLCWYLTAVLALCPPLAVLGAKRPGIRVWSWFVILPLLAVFVSPVVSPLLLSSTSDGARIPTPLLIGYAVVLLMGAGNYVGTRYALCAALFAVAVCSLLGPLSDAAPEMPLSPPQLRQLATACLSVALLGAGFQSIRPTAGGSRLDRLWLDYRDTFGIVWGRRLLERFNQRAAQENWSWRLADFGFVATNGRRGVPSPDETANLEAAMRWFLRRFVDDNWYAARTPSTTASNSPPTESKLPTSNTARDSE